MSLNLLTDVKALGLSKRTTNALINNHINVMRDLLALSAEELLALRGLGMAGIRELSELFRHLASIVEDDIISYSFGEYWKKIQKDERNFRILVDYYNNGADSTLQELGEKYQVAKVRVWQIITDGTNRLCEAFISGVIDDEICYTIDECAARRTEVHNLNIMDDVFTDVGISYLMASFKPSKYKVYTNRNLNGEWFIKNDDKIGKVLDLLIDELRYRPQPLMVEEVEKLYSVNSSMLMSLKGVVEKEGYVTHKSNKIALGTDSNLLVAQYLNYVERPASITEIVRHTGLSTGQVRGVLNKKEEYINVGRTTYDLVERKYDDAPVSDLAIKLLTAEDRALKAEAIIQYVQRYKSMQNHEILFAILNSQDIYQYAGYFLLKDWSYEKIQKNTRVNYRIGLQDAILKIVNDSDDIFDYIKMSEKLKERYGDAVSANLNSIRGSLSHMADKNLISRVGGTRTGCYARNSRTQPPISPLTNL